MFLSTTDDFILYTNERKREMELEEVNVLTRTCKTFNIFNKKAAMFLTVKDIQQRF